MSSDVELAATLLRVLGSGAAAHRSFVQAGLEPALGEVAAAEIVSITHTSSIQFDR